MGNLSREELIALVDKIRDRENYSEEESITFAAEFDENVTIPGASSLIFWPPEEERKEYEGRMRDWKPTSEQVVDRAMSYELNVTPMPASFPPSDPKDEK